MPAAKRNYTGVAALLGLILLAFVIGWLLPHAPAADRYDSRSVGPPKNSARFDDPVRGAP
ncbi:MAG TPA: hypothetical protein VEH76_03060 [Methylocystis sp.]|nr:hypothetical protein [Methylocystis sp.]